MLASFLIGLAGGQRAFVPLAAVAKAAARGELHESSGAPAILRNPLVAAASVAIAVAEMAGDKMKSAPDRVVPIGLFTRFVSSAIAGMALAPHRQRWLGAAVGGITAVAASYIGWQARLQAMETYSQTATGFVEDALVTAGAAAVVRSQPG